MPDDHAASSLASFRPAFTCLRSNSLTLSPRAALRPLPPPLAQLLLLCSMPFLPPLTAVTAALAARLGTVRVPDVRVADGLTRRVRVPPVRVRVRLAPVGVRVRVRVTSRRRALRSFLADIRRSRRPALVRARFAPAARARDRHREAPFRPVPGGLHRGLNRLVRAEGFLELLSRGQRQ